MAAKNVDREEQKRLKAFVARRHPLYAAMSLHWTFMQDTYAGGRSWFVGNIFRYMKEGMTEYADRVCRAYRFNHTREVVDLVNKYIFKMKADIVRRLEDAPDSVKTFWENATLSGLSMADYAERLSSQAAQNGRVWVVVDSNRTQGVATKADEKKSGVRAYVYTVLPQYALDMSYDDLGELNWILIQENVRDDRDPLNSTGKVGRRFRLWSKMSSQLFRIENEGETEKERIVPEEPIMHNLGVVPVIAVDNVISDDQYTSPALIADVAYLDRAIANYLSNLDAIIQDQTFSQLAMPAQGLMPGTDTDQTAINKLTEMGTKRIFLYNGEGGVKPEYLTPDVKQADLILKVVGKIINEIYHSVGLAGERTKDDNAQGIDNSSGVAKAYDFERVNALLAAKAGALERAENQIAHMVALWHGEEKAIDALSGSEESRELVCYPEDFDCRSLYDEFEIASRLILVEAPDDVRREQMSSVIDKLFPQVKDDLLAKLKASLKEWPMDPIVQAGLLAEATAVGPGIKGTATATPNPVKKQGTNALANKVVNS